VSAPRVWLYHAFGERSAEQDPHNLFVPLDAFRDQVRHLLTTGWRPLDLDGWLAHLDGRSVARKSFLLTVDDGYVSVLDAAAVLRELSVPSVLFVLAERLSGRSDWMPRMPDEPLLAAEDLCLLADGGMEIGAHGGDHTLLRNLDDGQLQRHTDDAAAVLQQVLGSRPRAFAYPEGVHDRAAVAAVARAGFSTAFSVHGRNVDGGTDRRFAVRRFDVNSTDTPRSFRLKASPWWPAAATVAARTPRLRATAHRVIGSAR
jgi:peptidoglycan/xylan/chitin deacetylase (PgdA/CDA1 family)